MSSEEYFREVFDASPTPSLLLEAKSPEFKLLFVNRAFFTELEHSLLDGIVGLDLKEVFLKGIGKADDWAEINSSLALVLQSGQSQTVSIPCYTSLQGEQSSACFLVKNTPILDDQNQVKSILQTYLLKERPLEGRDISSLQERHERKLLKASMELAQVGYWEVDLKEKTLKWSEVIYQIHEVDPGFEPDLDSAIHFYKEGEDRQRIAHVVTKAMETGESFDVELKIITAKGNERWVRATGITEMKSGRCIRIFGATQNITARKSIEERLQNITDNLPGVVFRYKLSANGKDKLKFVSKGAEKLWGISAEEAVDDNQQIWSRYFPEDLVPHKTSIFESAKTGKLWTHEWRVYHKDGSLRWHRGIGVPEKLEDGSTQWDSIILDVTQEKEMHQALERSEQAYKSLFEHNPDAVYSFDLEGNFISINQASTILAEGKVEDLLSQSFVPLIPPEDQERVYQNFLKAAQGEVLNYDTGFISLKGHRRIINVTNSPMVVNGEIVGVYGIAKDITDKRRLEKQVALERDLSNSIIANLPGLFFLYNKEGKFYRWNKNMEVVTGYDAEEINKMVPLDFFPEEQKEHVAAVIQRNFDEGIGRLEADLRLKSGKLLPYFFTGGLVQFKGEECILGFGINMSDQKQVEKDLVDAKKQYQTLVQTINGIVWEADAKTFRVNYISPQVEEILGYSPAQWLEGEGFWEEHIHPDDRESVTRYYREQTQKGKDHQFEYRIYSADGSVVWIKDVVSVHKEKGKPARLYGLMLNITAQKNAESVAQKNREALQKIMEQSIDVICTLDAKGHFRTVSNASKTLWGREPRELIGLPFENFVHKDSVQATKEAAEQIMSGINLTNFENKFLHKSGKGVAMIWSGKWDEKEKLMYAVGRDGTQKKRSERQLELSEKRFKSLVQDGSDLITILDVEGNYRYVSPTSSSVLGLAPEELVGKNAFAYIHAEDQEIVMQQFSHLEREKRVNVSPFRFKHKNGTWRWMETTVTNLTEEPAVRGIVANSRDVTEKRHLTEIDNLEKSVLEMNSIGAYSLEEILHFYLSGIEELHEGMHCSIMALRGGRLYSWSSESLPEDFIKAIEGQEIGPNAGSCGAAAYRKTRVIVPDIETSENWQSYRKVALGCGLRACWSTPILDSHQQVLATFAIYYPHRKAPTFLEENTIIRATNILQVMIENRLKREDLKQSNLRYELASKATNEAVYEWDIEQDHIQWSEGFQRLFGFDINEEQFPLDRWSQQLHPKDRKQVVECLSEALGDQRKSLWVNRYRFKNIKGKYAHVLENGFIIRNEKGKPVKMIGALRDISQQIEFEASLQKLNRKLEAHVRELEAANSELEQFAYVASHDLQEPLRMVSSFLTSLEKKYSDQLDEKAQKYIYFAVDGARRMRQIVLDLLEFSKVGKSRGQLKEVDILKVIENVKALYHGQMLERKATIITEGLPVLMTYSTPIHQLFQNLISNALKYAKEDVPLEVRVSAEEMPSHWKFSVSDNGIGIAPEYYEKIFLIFQRLHSREKYSGTGLGLAMSKKIVENMGGEIGVVSQVGEGSTFHFTIKKITGTNT